MFGGPLAKHLATFWHHPCHQVVYTTMINPIGNILSFQIPGFYSRRPTPTPSRKVRRSRVAGRPQKQRKNLPRTPQQPTLPLGGAWNRGWGHVERGQQLTTSQSPPGTRHPPTKRCSRFHCTLDRHPDTRSHDPVRSHPSRRNHTKSLQR